MPRPKQNLAKTKRRHLAKRSAIEAAGRPFEMLVPIEIQASDAPRADGRKGFSIIAYTGEPMNLPRFDLPVVIDCASLDLSRQSIPALLEHVADTKAVVGQVESISVNGGMPPIQARGYFTPTDEPGDAASMVMKKAAAGFRWQASVGGNPTRLDRIEANQTAALNGRTYTGPLYIARGTHFREISFTVIGADRRTSVAARSNPTTIQGNDVMEPETTDDGFNQWLLSLGFDSPDSLNPVQLANLQQMYDDESEEDDEEDSVIEPAEPVAAVNTPTNANAAPSAIQANTLTPGQPDAAAIQAAAVAAERDRIRGIGEVIELASPNAPLTFTASAGADPVNLEAHAIAQGWTVDRTRTEALNAMRRARPTPPAAIVRGNSASIQASALQCALLERSGAPLEHSAYRTAGSVSGHRLPEWLQAGANDVTKNRVIEAAGRFADISAVDLCREAIRLDGREIPQGREAMIQAAFSGSTLSNIFSTNLSALLLAAYYEDSDSTDEWTQTNYDVPNYLLQERTALVTAGGLSKLPAGGEADHDKRSDRMESYKLARYAKQFVIDEIDIINDNLSGFARVGPDMGKAAARLRPDLVYALILANPNLSATARALFNTTDGNRKTTAALAAATLRTAIASMWLFQENSVNINIEPTHIVVPPTLRHLAVELTTSPQIFMRGSTDAERGINNVLSSYNLKVVADSRLENGVVDPDSGTTYSGSSVNWYLACQNVPTIEVGYLRGSKGSPQIRSWNLSEGKFGRGWDVSLSIGVKALDWRGLLKNEG